MEKEEFNKEIIKEIQNNDNIKNYCMHFIEVNVLKHFQNENLTNEQGEILKYNIETVLEICGLDKDLYKDRYYPESNPQRKTIDKGKSIKTLKEFRKTFQISEKDFSDEGLLIFIVLSFFCILRYFL